MGARGPASRYRRRVRHESTRGATTLRPDLGRILEGGAIAAGASDAAVWHAAAPGAAALGALVLMRVAYGPEVALFELGRRWTWTLAVAGAIYGVVTLDSAWQHLRRREQRW